jgi:hypothetical protein
VRRDAELIREELDLWRQQLPAYEAGFSSCSAIPVPIHWVAQQPVSELNALVEYPKGMVALVIKPRAAPSNLKSSAAEFQARNPSPLSSNARAPKFLIPIASMPQIGWHLIFETRAAARFRRIYRLSIAFPIRFDHPLRKVHLLHSDSARRLLNRGFLQFPDAYGQGAGEMREGLKKCVKTAIEANDIGVKELPGEMGRTINFLIQNWPRRRSSPHLLISASIASPPICRTMGETLLSGPAKSPAMRCDGSPISCSMRFFRGTRPPAPKASVNIWRMYSLEPSTAVGLTSYLCSCCNSSAPLGTLAGIMGYSNGESLVARNVGLRALWSSGSWRVSLFFMTRMICTFRHD